MKFLFFWSDLEWIGFCRDQKDQRVSELVIIVSSAQTSGLFPLSASSAPTLELNNLPCWGLQGTASRVTTNPSWTGNARATLTGTFSGLGATQYFNQAEGRLRVQIGWSTFKTGTQTIDENYTEGGCTYRANGSFSASGVASGGDIGGSWMLNQFVGSVPDVFNDPIAQVIGPADRAYVMGISSSRTVTGTVSGPSGCGSTYTAAFGQLVATQADNFETGGMPKRVGPNGNLTGSLVVGNDTYTWDFQALREP
ncbi:MAG: hypothetical protein IT380_27730 [Myxococcales bacterium]|nr:hypothetical protein [Myxococcales bacterium]